MNRDDKNCPAQEEETSDEAQVSEGRRSAIAKAAYVAPVIAGVLFTSKASAQFSPPPPPG